MIDLNTVCTIAVLCVQVATFFVVWRHESTRKMDDIERTIKELQNIVVNGDLPIDTNRPDVKRKMGNRKDPVSVGTKYMINNFFS